MDNPKANNGLGENEKTSEGSRIFSISSLKCFRVKNFLELDTYKSKNPPDTTYVTNPTNVISPPI